MKAAVIREFNRLSVEESVELADPGPGQVRVRIVATGLCHTDIAILQGSLPLPLPLVPGHEGAGVVEAVGPGVSDLVPGDHVVLSVTVACGNCFQCRSGARSLCEVAAATMFAGTLLDGTSRLSKCGETLYHFLHQSSFAEYVVVPTAGAVKIRKDAPLETVCLLADGATTGIGAVINKARVRPGQSVVILGVGGVGLSAMLAARMVGATPIIAVDRAEPALKAAERLGATHLIDASKDDVVAEVVRITTRGADHAFDVVGAEGTIETCLGSVRPGGQVVVVGASSATTTATVDIMSMLNEKRLTGTSGGSVDPHLDIPRCVDLFMGGRLPLDELVTSSYTLDNIAQALADLEQGRIVGRGVIVQK